jgi:hypothetical protein
MSTRERGALSDTEYESIESAVMETARGRWFLAEHARRHRLVETEVLRALLERLEAALRLVLPLDGNRARRHAPPSPRPQVEHGFNFESFLAAAPTAGTALAAESSIKHVASPQGRDLTVSGITRASFDHRDRRYVQQIALGRDHSRASGS